MSLETNHPSIPSIDGAASTRRRELFCETPAERLRRWGLGTAWALKPQRLGGLPGLGGMWLTDLLARQKDLPNPDAALAVPAGLCGFAHDVSVPTLIEAHRRGLYPFAHLGPLKWWSPPQRCVLAFEDFYMSKRLRSRLRQAR